MKTAAANAPAAAQGATRKVTIGRQRCQRILTNKISGLRQGTGALFAALGGVSLFKIRSLK
jgi:hypothetical protein